MHHCAPHTIDVDAQSKVGVSTDSGPHFLQIMIHQFLQIIRKISRWDTTILSHRCTRRDSGLLSRYGEA